MSWDIIWSSLNSYPIIIISDATFLWIMIKNSLAAIRNVYLLIIGEMLTGIKNTIILPLQFSAKFLIVLQSLIIGWTSSLFERFCYTWKL